MTMLKLSLILATTILIMVMKTSRGMDFHVLVFGGAANEGGEVEIYNLNEELAVCKVTPLPHSAGGKPFASIINGIITVCGGGLTKCHQLVKSASRAEWRPYLSLDRFHASAVTTFDFSEWTFFGGGSDQAESYSYLLPDASDFATVDFHVFCCGCSARLNQTHAIFLEMSFSGMFWYQEEIAHSLIDWDGADKPQFQGSAACGTIFSKEHGYQFLSAGGFYITENIRTTWLFSFDVNNWSQGQSLPHALSNAVSVQYQNTVVLMGGIESDLPSNYVLKYDFEEGWLELPVKLTKPNAAMGALHVEKSQLDLCMP